MNLNDMRRNAYQNAAGKKDDAAGKEIKPFVPKAFIKSSELSSDLMSGKKTVSDAKTFQPFDSQNIKSKKNDLQPPVDNHAKLDEAATYLKSGGLVKVPVKEPQKDGSDSVYRRVAKFLLLIGENEAAKILPHLSEEQIDRIIPEIASIRTVSKEEAAVILEEFNALLEQAKQSGGVETAREMLEKAYGKRRADEMIKKAMPLEGKKPFDYLNDADSEKVYYLLKDENPGMQTLVLSRINPQKAAAVINLMSPGEKKEVVMRLAKMEPVSPEVLARVDHAMHEKSLNQTTEKAEVVDGRNALAQILKKMDLDSENDILDSLSENDPDLSEDLRHRLFTIDDVVNSDDKFIQGRLRLMDDSDVAYLIAGKTDAFRDKILDNVSSARRMDILQQEDLLKPMRKKDVDKITAEFCSILRRAYEEGHLIIKDRNDDVYV